MPSDRIETLVNELAAELDREQVEDREALARWYQGMLEAEYRKNERAVSFTEMLRSAHGLGQGEDDSPPA